MMELWKAVQTAGCGGRSWADSKAGSWVWWKVGPTAQWDETMAAQRVAWSASNWERLTAGRSVAWRGAKWAARTAVSSGHSKATIKAAKMAARMDWRTAAKWDA